MGGFHRNILRLETETFDPRNTRHVIVNSEMVRQEILAHFPFPAERIHLVRNGVEVVRFQAGDRAATRQRFGVHADELLLLFVGSGWERKGLRYLLAALGALQRETTKREWLAGARQFQEASRRVTARIRSTILGPHAAAKPPSREPATIPADKIKLLVVGKGRKPLHLPSNVMFAGPMNDVENACAAADLFVFLPIYEPSANVVFEALAAGLPVITSARNGASELIEEGVNGTVVDDPSDTRSVVEAIADWWARRFCTPPLHAADLSLERNVSETLAVLELAAKERGA
jgi:UDP-glucose:(heptosyl)LPS alpha-1,3-glucosyltransferase